MKCEKQKGQANSHGVRYPWDEWFAVDGFTIRHGREYSCMPHGMVQNVRRAAAARGLSVSVSIEADGLITVTVRGPARGPAGRGKR